MKSNQPTSITEIDLVGAKLSLLNLDQLLNLIFNAVQNGDKALILSGNVHAYNLTHQQPWLRDLFNQADAVRLDGAGVRLGAYILGYSTPPRMTWADFGWDLAAFAEENHLSLFLLGARSDIAKKAAARLRNAHPNLNIVGIRDGYFTKTEGSPENADVIQMINESRPDILIVGFGMPLQEQWLRDNWDGLDINVAITGGAVFDYLSGEQQRAPAWMTNYGFEWLGRLLLEPRRLWKRYIIGNPVFLWRVLRQRTSGKNYQIRSD